ncbi:MAG: hypothetical protein AAB969_01335 [Patescibacteria group bacterium]
MKSNKSLLSLSGILFLMIVVNLLIIFYWVTRCSLADSQIEQFFYCDGKEGPSLNIYLLFGLSSIIIALPVLISLISSFFVEMNIKLWIKITILIIFGIIFLSPFFLLISGDISITLNSYKIEREQGMIYAEQAQEEWLNSDEYKKLQEESRQRSCDMAKESIKNWQKGEPIPLLPNGCE